MYHIARKQYFLLKKIMLSEKWKVKSEKWKVKSEKESEK